MIGSQSQADLEKEEQLYEALHHKHFEDRSKWFANYYFGHEEEYESFGGNDGSSSEEVTEAGRKEIEARRRQILIQAMSQ